MRLARKLFLLAAMALAALAMSATAASASETIEVHEMLHPPTGPEVVGPHCDPCNIHVTGESRIALTANPAIVISRCEDEFDAEIYEDGSGHITSLTNANHAGGNCTTQQCNGVGEAPTEVEWEFSMEEISADTSELATTFCLDTKANPNNVGSHCPADVIVTEPATHDYAFALNQACPSGTTVIGNWSSEGDSIEIEHLP